MRAQPGLYGLLFALGIAWGLSVPLTKYAVMAGYRDFGIIFWQATIDVVILLPWVLWRGGGLPRHAAALAVYAFIAVFGTLAPSLASYTAARFLPAGVVALCLSLIPLVALPVAVLLGTDRASPGRVLGLCLGLIGVGLILLPETSLPDRKLAMFVPLALVAPLFYAFEGNVIARWGTAGLSPVQMVAGASVISMLVAGPLALVRGVFINPAPPWGLAEAAIVGSAIISISAYVGYLTLIGRAGAVFAAQVSYLVTGFGVLWAMLLLGERFSVWFWAALAVIFLGLFLVQPRTAASAAGQETAAG
jgi:drug/metabolite transporter (DMT)-like permease